MCNGTKKPESTENGCSPSSDPFCSFHSLHRQTHQLAPMMADIHASHCIAFSPFLHLHHSHSAWLLVIFLRVRQLFSQLPIFLQNKCHHRITQSTVDMKDEGWGMREKQWKRPTKMRGKRTGQTTYPAYPLTSHASNRSSLSSTPPPLNTRGRWSPFTASSLRHLIHSYSPDVSVALRNPFSCFCFTGNILPNVFPSSIHQHPRPMMTTDGRRERGRGRESESCIDICVCVVFFQCEVSSRSTPTNSSLAVKWRWISMTKGEKVEKNSNASGFTIETKKNTLHAITKKKKDIIPLIQIRSTKQLNVTPLTAHQHCTKENEERRFTIQIQEIKIMLQNLIGSEW